MEQTLVFFRVQQIRNLQVQRKHHLVHILVSHPNSPFPDHLHPNNTNPGRAELPWSACRHSWVPTGVIHQAEEIDGNCLVTLWKINALVQSKNLGKCAIYRPNYVISAGPETSKDPTSNYLTNPNPGYIIPPSNNGAVGLEDTTL
jgi:hypothetical protein